MKRSEVEALINELGVDVEESKKKEFTDAIMKLNGTDMNNANTKIESVKNDLKVKEGLIEELNAKIKENASVDIEKIKKEQFDLGKAEGSKEFENFKKTNALEKALGNYKAKDVKLVQKLLDLDKIKYEEKEGNYTVNGVDEQINNIKETHSYLFEDENNNNAQNINLGGDHNKNANIDSDLQAVASAMGIEIK